MMKQCPRCQRLYEDSAIVCAPLTHTCNGRLVEVSRMPPALLPEERATGKLKYPLSDVFELAKSICVDPYIEQARRKKMESALMEISRGPKAEIVSFEKSKEMAEWICRVTDLATNALSQ